MAEHTIYIIRHGEKPLPGIPDPGLMADGTTDPESLLVRGWQRAGAWAVLFGSPGGDTFKQPDAIYASAHTAPPGSPPPSKRPWETIVPLAARVGVEPNVDWAQGQERQLADTVAARDGVTLICWEHSLIMSGILVALPIGDRSGIPGRWKGHRFDVVFRLWRGRSLDPYQFEQLTPCLLDGDKDHPMK